MMRFVFFMHAISTKTRAMAEKLSTQRIPVSITSVYDSCRAQLFKLRAYKQDNWMSRLTCS